MSSFLAVVVSVLSLLELIYSQQVGRYELDTQAYNMFFDVNENKTAYLVFRCKGSDASRNTFQDGPYDLIKGPGYQQYKFDLSKVREGFAYWYVGIKSVCNNVTLRSGDLTSISYLNSDEVSTYFSAGRVTLKRYAHELTPGWYLYTSKSATNIDGITIRYRVRRDSIIEVDAQCNQRSTKIWPFRLVRNNGRFQYTSYDITDAGRGSVSKFQDKVRWACPNYLGPLDFGYVVFASRGTIFSELEGARISLTRTNSRR